MSSRYDPDQQSTLIRMGYWISEKKSKKLNIEQFATFCRNAGVMLVKLDLDRNLSDQGPFDVIFHKLTDILAKVKLGSQQAKKQIQHFQHYVHDHPEVAVVDPLENLTKLMDRHYTYQFVKECEVLEKEYQYFMPNFVEFNSTDVETNKLLMERNGVQFPFICKPTVAHGSSQCHQMAIIFNEEGLKDVEPPCVAQTFINHNAVLYKIFVIGKKHFVVPRPSLKNFFAGNYKTIHFDSACVSKPHSCTFLNVLDEEDVYHSHKVQPDMDCLENLARGLQEKLGLDLIGVDVIIENKTGRYAVVDINAFPGYENGIDDLYGCLLNVFLETLKRHRSRQIQEPPSVISHNTPVSTNVPTLTSSDSGLGEQPFIPSDKSSEADVSRMSEDLYSFHLNRDCDCNLKKELNKDNDEFFLCNHQYVNMHQNNSRTAVSDSSVWNEMLIEENNTTNTSSSIPCHHSSWSVD